MIKARLERVRRHMRAQKLEQLIVTQPQSIYYLTGQWVMPLDRLDALVITADECRMLCYNLAVIEPEGCKTVIYSDMSRAIPCLIDMLDRVATGVDGEMPSRFSLPLTDMLDGVRVVPANCVELARMVKDEDEIARLKYASELTDAVFTESFAYAVPGMTERELARVFCERFEAHGAGSFPGLPMTAFGAGSADVHHSTGDAVLARGDAIMVDTGMRIDGYYSDTTRTAFMGECSDHQRRIYEIVLRANEAAIAAVRPGALLTDADRAARGVIEKAGYGALFTHKTSHGVGIDFHELPTDRADAPVVLEPGMAFSIEPGIYIEGEFGVRIEDLAIVTSDGICVATHCPKTLMVL